MKKLLQTVVSIYGNPIKEDSLTQDDIAVDFLFMLDRARRDEAISSEEYSKLNDYVNANRMYLTEF